MSTTSATETGTGQEPDSRMPARLGIALALIVSCEMILMLDTTIMNVALPSVQAALGFSEAGLSWIVNAFALAFGGFLLLGGRAGDLLGRRAMFIAGTATFTVASLLGGLAPTAWWLIVARILQGVGAAMAGPSTLSLLITHFEDGPRRTKALGVYSTVTGLGMALGLLLGGVLTALASWRWVLFINVPIGAAVILLAPRYLSESARSRGRFDVVGSVLSTLGMTGLVYGFIRAAASGWDGPTWLVFAVAVVLLAAFVAVETRAEQPILPLHLFASRNRSGSYLAMLLVPATLFGIFFFMTQYLQDVFGYSALLSGLAFLPTAATLFVVAAYLVGPVLPRLGTKGTALLGVAAVTASVAWLSLLTPGVGYAAGVLGPMILFGGGVGFTVVPLNMIIMSDVEPSVTGAASGALQAFQQIGGSLGLSILVTVFGAATAVAGGGASSPATGHRLDPQLQTAGTSAAFMVGTLFSLAALVALAVLITTKSAPADGDDAESGNDPESSATTEAPSA